MDEQSKKDIEQNELTRREWLLRLGETAAIVGFSGVTADVAFERVMFGLPAEQKALLPGLYEPSNDHLSHALSAEGVYHPIPPGAETDYVRPRTGPYQPQFFSSEEFRVIRRLVAIILGEDQESPRAEDATKTRNPVDEVSEWIDLAVHQSAAVRTAARSLSPERRSLAVHYYGLAAVEEIENRDLEKACREGLAWLADESKRRFNKQFSELQSSQQLELTRAISDDRPDKATENAGTRFFEYIKAETIRGFFTSKAGLRELDYKGNAFYAVSPGCESS